MSETSEAPSETTIEPFSFEKVLEALDNGCKETIESKDYLSYSTLIDIYLSDHQKYTNDEKEELLKHILKILNENKQLTYEIGWDLPSLLIPYIDSQYEFDNGVRNSPCVYTILKIFESLAFNGNPKELFLKCCELLTTIKTSDSKQTDNKEFRERFFDIKLYCIFELIDSCLKRIETLYPSRFLSMTVSSYINLAHINLVQEKWSPRNQRFILKRAYSFTRNYISPKMPTEIDPQVTKEELKKIQEDEEYLQRKLLTGFLTQLVALCGVGGGEGFAMDHFSWLQSRGKSKITLEYEIDPTLYNRLVELAYSFDIPLNDIFNKFVKDSNKLFEGFDYDIEGNDEELSGAIFEKVIIDYQKNVYSSIIDSDSKTINNSLLGELALFTHKIAISKKFDKLKISFYDAIVIGLRLLIPQLVESKFITAQAQDISAFWMWYALHQSCTQGKKIEIEVSKVPRVLLMTYYQGLLFLIIDCRDKPNHRFMLLTLLTRLLIVSPEDIGYDFIMDTLDNCPYEGIKAPVIGVYKELLLKEKGSTCINELTDKLSKSTLEEVKKETGDDAKKEAGDDAKEKAVPPPLPERKNSASSSGKYYTFTEERLDDFLELILIAQSNAFISQNKEISIDSTKLSTLAAALNLLVVLKNDPVVVEHKEKLNRVLKTIENNINEIKTKHKGNEENSFELNAAGMLEITIERFKE
ncbi:uncharacterized protein J8A68_003941 [[Candida] subhashii]|uniref:Uncharacterized protein n=1 Tax=[Candida] subhashii TaxID=561895 RepID=A0A8J5QTY4_9ASCO|nr:uncharacterized protein J8A68_003941 [[Candida] subhashii]KAG7662545.1 hypothetical protein J8A68_003941 [[Candida] subhashii]